MDEEEKRALRQEARRLREEINRLQQEMLSVHPPNRLPTESEKCKIDQLYVQVGKLTEAYSRVWVHGPTRMYQCPCCGLYTLDEEPPGTYAICPVCWWEDDPVQFRKPDYRGGANSESLNEAREAFRRNGIVGPR